MLKIKIPISIFLGVNKYNHSAHLQKGHQIIEKINLNGNKIRSVMCW